MQVVDLEKVCDNASRAVGAICGQPFKLSRLERRNIRMGLHES